ncbi:doublesex- and mab-3-related transcription factor DM-W-like [Actinia tenebrosa]|uniref:Doublesex- and mab-3-related transcription factor DM-W-like n=1 Tax=Actinia tenebrosa TaxID=6105 RepID=A0A6P8ITG7_ACTTE|nr:doublesex- and mab-3-related transcription factor DM-W-like [Actinia tenebrosa]
MNGKESRGQERRCRKCKAHGKTNYLKNYHKKKCEYKDCDCKTCTMVTRTRERSKIILQKKRQMIKEQKLQEQRNVGEMPADFHPCLHKGMPVAVNRQSPQHLLTMQQTQFHSTQFQSYVTNMTKLVARILQQTTSAEDIPSNLYDVVAKTFNPSWSMSSKASAITNGPNITTTFGSKYYMGTSWQGVHYQ